MSLIKSTKGGLKLQKDKHFTQLLKGEVNRPIFPHILHLNY